MMSADVIDKSACSRLRLTKHEAVRALGAGVSFCIVMTTGFAAMSAWQCGGICLPEVADNALLSLSAGLIGLGPLAVYGNRH